MPQWNYLLFKKPIFLLFSHATMKLSSLSLKPIFLLFSHATMKLSSLLLKPIFLLFSHTTMKLSSLSLKPIFLLFSHATMKLSSLSKTYLSTLHTWERAFPFSVMKFSFHLQHAAISIQPKNYHHHFISKEHHFLRVNVLFKRWTIHRNVAVFFIFKIKQEHVLCQWRCFY